MATPDFKSINSTPNNVFEVGYIQNIEVGESGECVFIWSHCLLEMCKDQVYKVVISLHKVSFEVVNACCGCPAGKDLTTFVTTTDQSNL